MRYTVRSMYTGEVNGGQVVALVQVSVPQGGLTRDQKRQLVVRITGMIVDVEGIPQLRASVHVLVSEVADGRGPHCGRLVEHGAPDLNRVLSGLGRSLDF